MQGKGRKGRVRMMTVRARIMSEKQARKSWRSRRGAASCARMVKTHHQTIEV